MTNIFRKDNFEKHISGLPTGADTIAIDYNDDSLSINMAFPFASYEDVCSLKRLFRHIKFYNEGNKQSSPFIYKTIFIKGKQHVMYDDDGETVIVVSIIFQKNDGELKNGIC